MWGKPSSETASELRWGTHGSRVVNREKGVWYDHERGVGGGTLVSDTGDQREKKHDEARYDKRGPHKDN